MTSLRFRAAGPDDAEKIALLHADSWRRHYRGAYADSFLDGDVVANRRSVWSSRLAAPANSTTVVAEDDTGLVGFVHVVFDEDDRWGSFIDNLHVSHKRRRTRRRYRTPYLRCRGRCRASDMQVRVFMGA